MRRFLGGLLLGGGLLVAAMGCSVFAGGVDASVADGYAKIAPATVAVLPAANITVDPAAAAVVRPLLAEMFVKRGYDVLPLDRTDELLRQKYAADMIYELDSVPPKAAMDLLGVDAVLYTKMTDWTESRLTTRAHYEVGGEFRLAGRPGGEILWSAEHRVFRQSPMTSPLDYNAAAEWPADFPSLARDLVNDLAGTVPPGPKVAAQ